MKNAVTSTKTVPSHMKSWMSTMASGDIVYVILSGKRKDATLLYLAPSHSLCVEYRKILRKNSDTPNAEVHVAYVVDASEGKIRLI